MGVQGVYKGENQMGPEEGANSTGAQTREEAAEQGRRGAQIAKERRRQLEEDPLGFVSSAPIQADLVGMLISAARGVGSFRDLSPDKRLSAILKLLEYSVGKPGTAAKGSPSEQPLATPESTEGITIE